jgi:hypothetical protein
MTLADIADWCARTRGALRGGYVRLREENRALLNSVLGTAGVPPIETPTLHPASVPAVRRRSWPQIATTREIEAARRARAKEREPKV